MVEFRTARREDLPAIVRLLADDGLGRGRERLADPLPPEYGAAFDAMARQDGNEILLAIEDGAIVGCLQLTIIPGLSRLGATRAQLEGVRVDGTRRGSGIGEALIREAIARARRAGCALVQLTSDRRRADALRFYERLGFEPSHVGMKLELDRKGRG